MSLSHQLISLPRRIKQLIMLLTDGIFLPICFLTAVSLRLGAFPLGTFYHQYNQHELFLYAVLITVVSLPLLYLSGLYRSVLGYLEFKTATKSGLSVLISAIFVYAFVYYINKYVNNIPVDTDVLPFPRSSIIIFSFIAFSYLMGSRYVALVLLHHRLKITLNAKRVAIWGAGAAGAQTVAALRNTPEYLPVCFFDADVQKTGTLVCGLPVYLPESKRLATLLKRFDIQHVILAMPSASPLQRQSVINSLLQLPSSLQISTQILPGMTDLVDGTLTVSRLRPIELEDLLGREVVEPNPELFDRCIGNKIILVSGAGGSIGSELCRQIISPNHHIKPKTLIILERNEYALYTLEQELLPIAKAQGIELIPCLGDTAHHQVLDFIFKRYQVNTVYHAAAYKHVPLVEANPCVGVMNNVASTLALTQYSVQYHVEHFILVSTDKAVRPTNVMGASKRVAEQIVQAYSANRANDNQLGVFCMVRFGNVLGSSGSVIPKFMAQIQQGGPVTVTHPDIIRYFMLIPEAAQLVIQAGGMASGGEVFVLDMGEPVKIVNLAEQAIRLSGHTLKNKDNPHGDIAIEFTGLRPGEKLYEELLIEADSTDSEHAKILQAHESFMPIEKLNNTIHLMLAACQMNDTPTMLNYLKQIVPEFNHKP